MTGMDSFPPINGILWRIVFVDFVLCIFNEARSQCVHGPTTLNADSTVQFFMSPGYPTMQYAPNDRCYWRIAASNKSHVVRIDVEDSIIEYHKNCEWDYVQVFDGAFITSESLGIFCGSAEPTYVSTGPYMFVELVSDFSDTFKGFKIKYYSGKRESLTYSSTSQPTTTDNTPAIIGASFGGLLFLIVLSGIAYSCYTSKKNKSLRRRSREHRIYDRVEIQPRRTEQFERQHAWRSFHTNVSRPPIYTSGPPPPYREPSAPRLPLSPPPPYEYIAPNQTHSFSSPTANT